MKDILQNHFLLFIYIHVYDADHDLSCIYIHTTPINITDINICEHKISIR